MVDNVQIYVESKIYVYIYNMDILLKKFRRWWLVSSVSGFRVFRVPRGLQIKKSTTNMGNNLLGGGFKYFLCSLLFGEDSHFD